MEAMRQTLIDGILQAQKSLLVEMQAAATPEWIDLDLTIAQVKALFILEAHGPMTVGQAANHLGTGKPAASILIDRLVQTGLVTRTEDAIDRRRTNVKFTEAGKELVTRLREGRKEVFLEALGSMGDEDLEALLKGLNGLNSSFSANRFAPKP